MAARLTGAPLGLSRATQQGPGMIRIGIACDYETYTDSRGQEAARYFLGSNYVDALMSVGAMPLMLPYGDINRIPELLSLVHGIVIAGGDFDHPQSFMGKVEAKTRAPDPRPKRFRTNSPWQRSRSVFAGPRNLWGHATDEHPIRRNTAPRYQ